MTGPTVILKLIRVFWRMRRLKPTFVSFNSLNACNQACPMCAVWRRGGEMLTVQEMAPIFADLKCFGFLVTEISGGEPFLREDIYDIFAMLDRLGFLYTTATNGTLFTPEGIERLSRAHGLLQLAVSIDSLDRETYARLRGRDLLPTAMQNLDLLIAAGLHVPLKVNLVMNRINYRETFDFLAFARERGIYLSVFPVNQGEGFFHRHSDAQYKASPEEQQEMAAIFRELARLRRAGEPLWEYSGFYEQAADYLLGLPVGSCDAAGLYIDLNADGQVAVCLDREGVGDVRSTSIAELWQTLQGERGQIRACQEETPCFYTCTYNISITARNEAAFLWETARVRLRRAMAKRFRRRQP
ncbi:MAG: radical SAM protein [Geobacter sp.]|nr:radical SAM protein [Geobacter sp.]